MFTLCDVGSCRICGLHLRSRRAIVRALSLSHARPSLVESNSDLLQGIQCFSTVDHAELSRLWCLHASPTRNLFRSFSLLTSFSLGETTDPRQFPRVRLTLFTAGLSIDLHSSLFLLFSPNLSLSLTTYGGFAYGPLGYLIIPAYVNSKIACRSLRRAVRCLGRNGCIALDYMQASSGDVISHLSEKTIMEPDERMQLGIHMSISSSRPHSILF